MIALRSRIGMSRRASSQVHCHVIVIIRVITIIIIIIIIIVINIQVTVRFWTMRDIPLTGIIVIMSNGIACTSLVSDTSMICITGDRVPVLTRTLVWCVFRPRDAFEVMGMVDVNDLLAIADTTGSNVRSLSLRLQVASLPRQALRVASRASPLETNLQPNKPAPTSSKQSSYTPHLLPLIATTTLPKRAFSWPGSDLSSSSTAGLTRTWRSSTSTATSKTSTETPRLVLLKRSHTCS
eukprot:3445930-Rhodomonas_salina.1